MPNVRDSSGTIGTIALADAACRAAASRARARTPSWSRSRARRCRRAALERPTASAPPGSPHVVRRLRQRPAQRRAPLAQVVHLGRVVGRGCRTGSAARELLVGDRELEAVAELAAAPPRSSFFCWCVMFWPSPDVAHAVALDRLGEDHRRLALVLDGRVVRGVDLARVVAAAVAAPRSRSSVMILRPARAAPGTCRRSARARRRRRVTCTSGSRRRRTRSISRTQQPVARRPREQRIPARAPDHLDHVPAGAAEVAPRAPG